MINVRDLTDQEGLYESKSKIKQLQQAVERLSNELDHPISAAKKNACELYKSFSSILQVLPPIQKRFDVIQYFTKFSSLKIKSFKDFGEMGTNRLRAKLANLDVKTVTEKVIKTVIH